MYAYPYKGYWRDVGTIQSLWDANMDLIKSREILDLQDPKWKIYTNTMAMPPQYIGKDAVIKNSLVADGCMILGSVEQSVLSHGVSVGENSKVKDSVIMPNVTIGKNVIIEKAMIGEGAIIEDNVIIKNNNDEINVVSEYEVIKDELVLEGGM
jgi:glucose-1-phosphate adenylyltransferase